MRPRHLRERRQSLGLSQADLGRTLGVARNTVARWERGELEIRHPELVSLALDRLARQPETRADPAVDEKRRNNLPAETTSFIGREDEVAALCEQLGNTRLLTLAGTGGVGKTRLALHVARQVLTHFPGGVWWVDLAPLSDPALIGRTIAAVLHVGENAMQPTAASLASSIGRQQMLLVLDNCEHLLEGFLVLLGGLFSACPQLRVLATTREPLGLSAETVHAVLPLPTLQPDGAYSPERLLQLAAVQLLLERTMAHGVQAPTADQVQALADICWRLDGLPLALELAAARLPAIGALELNRRLTDALGVLTWGPRDSPDRHTTLRATLDWSYALLSPAEQRLLARLSIFVGGWSLEACEGIAADNSERSSVLDLLGRLVSKSLVVTEPGPAGSTRYRMLETVRQYAAECIAQSGELNAIRARYRDWYLAMIEHAPGDGRRPLGRNHVLAALDADADNIRVALNSSMQDPTSADRALGAAGKIWWFWTDRVRPLEGFELLERLLACAGETASAESRAEGVYGACLLAWTLGGARLRKARELADEAVALRRRLGGPARVAHVLCGVSRPLMDVGDSRTARLFLDESLELAEAQRIPQTVARCLHGLGTLAHRRLDLVSAAKYYARAFELCREIQDRYGMTTELGTWLLLEYQKGDWRSALARAREALLLRRELRARTGQHELLGVVAGVAARQHQPDRAVRLYGASLQLRQQFGIEREVWRSDVLAQLLSRDLAYARTRIGAAAFAHGVAAGRQLQLEEALNEAQVAIDQALANSTGGHGDGHLTAREAQVAELVGRGLTNRQIADTLVVTEATAAKHVEHILDRLGFSSRSQIAAWVASRAEGP
ncbi:MAG: helix-turn-helix domain-containing protein [Chloroflexi bacterium]|nr:helix-turn-helix domain-containing protein [Chloroflexota bacterium]